MHSCRSTLRFVRAARLRAQPCDEVLCAGWGPASLQLTSNRGIKLFEHGLLQEDMQHGYFDDFRAVRDQQGKIFASTNRLIDAQVAQKLPATQMVRPDGVEAMIPPPVGHYKAALLCTAFRAGAEDMLASWSQPFRECYGVRHGAHYYELSFVESAVMSVWPFKQMILRAQLKQSPILKAQPQAPHSINRGASPSSTSASPSFSSSSQSTISVPRDLLQQKLSGIESSSQSHAQPAYELSAESAQGVERGYGGSGSHGTDVQNSSDIQGSPGKQGSPGMQGQAGAAGSSPGEPLQTDYLFHFGDTTEIRKALEMPNRLTGYAFLIDSQGLVRWRGSGKAEQAEVDSLLWAAHQLLK